MKRALPVVVCLFLAAGAHPLWSQDDAEGCKDSPLISRMPGTSIYSCDSKEYDQVDITVANKKRSEVSKHVEGPMSTWDYGTVEGVSEVVVFQNFETELRNDGFQITFERWPDYISAHKGNTWVVMENNGSEYLQTVITEQAMKQQMTADAAKPER